VGKASEADGGQIVERIWLPVTKPHRGSHFLRLNCPWIVENLINLITWSEEAAVFDGSA
jgi:hypothetical protein